jgi:hypothetical protein
MVMALADIKWNPHINKTIPMSQQLADHDYMLKTHADNFSSYWYGYKNGDDFAPRPTSSEWIKVNGSYTAMHRKRCISQKIDIGGNMTIKPPQLP